MLKINNKKVALISLIIYPFYLIIGVIAFCCSGVAAFGSWGQSASSVRLFMNLTTWLFSAPYIILYKLEFAGGTGLLIISTLLWCYIVPFTIVYLTFYMIENNKIKA